MAKIKSLTNEENKPPASHPVSSYKFKEIKWSPKKNTIHKAKAIKTEIKVERKLKRVVRSRDVVIDKKSKKTATTNLNLDKQLRYIIIDGSNVAREHGRKNGNFSCQGIKLVVEYFCARGHKDIKVFLPRFRRGNSDLNCPTVDPHILDELEHLDQLCYTPSRFIENKLIVPYDDRFILKAAAHFNGVIVSNDNYRDLIHENKDWKRIVETSLLQYSFVGDLFLVADDPFGKNGPSIEQFLSKSLPFKNSTNTINQFDYSRLSFVQD